MKRPLKIAGIVVGVILLLVIILPFLVNVNSFRPTLESELSTALGRQVKVGELGLSILSGSVSAADLSIADDPAFGKDPFVRAKSLKVGVEVMPLIFSKALHVTEITLEQPQIVLLQSPAGKWNFSTLGNTSSPKPASAPKDKSAGVDFSVSKLNVKDGRLSMGHAGSNRKPQIYENVNITVRDFSLTSKFPFTLTANLPGGGDLKLGGKAGPINPGDASLTPVQAEVDVKKMNLAGFTDPAAGIAGLVDLDGKLNSDGRKMGTTGTLKAEKLKLAAKGSPADRLVQVKFAVDDDLQTKTGTLTQGAISMGKAVAQLTGTFQTQGDSTVLNMRLNGQGMPVDELVAMLPSLGVVLPSGSSLKGGTLSTTLAITGTAANPIITGPIRLADTRLAGFNLGSKLSALSSLSGAKSSGSDTSIQNFSTDTRVAPDGVRTDNVNLTVPSLGVITGNGTISPAGALNYKMNANLSGGAVTGITQMAGLGGKGGGAIPFFIQGTTSNPTFVPDVQGMVGNKVGSALSEKTGGQSPVDALGGIFGKKKKKP